MSLCSYAGIRRCSSQVRGCLCDYITVSSKNQGSSLWAVSSDYQFDFVFLYNSNTECQRAQLLVRLHVWIYDVCKRISL